MGFSHHNFSCIRDRLDRPKLGQRFQFLFGNITELFQDFQRHGRANTVAEKPICITRREVAI